MIFYLYCAYYFIFFIISIIDLKEFRIPNKFVFCLIVIVVFTWFFISLPSAFHILAAIFWGLFFTVVHMYSKGGLGFGDVKLIFVTACFLQPHIFYWALNISFLTAAFCAGILILIFKKSIKTGIAYAPFLFFACILSQYIHFIGVL